MKTIENTSITEKNLNNTVELYGWVQKKRDLGGVIFIDLRDRSGLIQLVIRPDSKFYHQASTLKSEYVIKVKGIVQKREQENPKMKTGKIEIEVTDLELINTASELPFEIKDDTSALEDTRLKYRYLD